MSKRRRRNLPAVVTKAPVPVTVGPGMDPGGWVTVFDSTRDPSTAFQRDVRLDGQTAQRNSTVFACETLIAGDISKLAILLLEKMNGVWQETESPAYRKFLRKPNSFQTLQQFIESWQLSKQRRGNAYVLLERDETTRVSAAYVLDPDRVTPMVAPNGDVFYGLCGDKLAGVPDEDAVVPASEIMHDRMNTLFHPLIGLPPLYASNLSAVQGLTIQEQSQLFFANSSRPGGLLVSPQMIQPVMAEQYKRRWEEQYGGGQRGKVAVLGNGLKYEPIAQNAVDSELTKQLGMTDEKICSTFHVPAYKVGVGPMPAYQSAEILNQIYYDSCLQKQIEAIESLLNDGLQLWNVNGRVLRAQFDIDGLLRMDNRTLIAAIAEGVKAGVMTPNEGRQRLNLPPVTGGNSPYLQQQNYSLLALAKRDAQDDPFASKTPAAAPSESPAAANDDNAAGDSATAAAKAVADLFCEELEYEHA